MTERPDLAELALRAADGELTAEEQEAFAAALAAGDEGTKDALAALELEAALVATRRNPELAGGVMAAVGMQAPVAAPVASLEAATVASVMKRIGTSSPRRRRWPLLALLGGGVALAAGATSFVRERPRRQATGETPVASVEAPPRFVVPPPPDAGDRAVAPPAEDTTVFTFTFEDGAPPAGVRVEYAAVAPCPVPRADSRYCLIGGVSRWSADKYNVMLEARERPLGTFASTQALHFAYYLGPEAPARLNVQMKDGDQRQNHDLVLTDVVRGAWARATVRIADLVPVRDRHRRIADGDAVKDLTILGGRMGRDPLLVDDVRLVDHVATPLPRSQTEEIRSPRSR